MDLFVINRYKGEDEEIESADQESLNLQRLKKRIEERKKARESKAKLTSVIAQFSEEVVHTVKLEEIKPTEVEDIPKKHKKRKTEASDEKIEQVQEIPEKDEDIPIEESKPAPEFQVLGIEQFEKKVKVKRVLPYWLSHPIPVSLSLQNLTTPLSTQNWLNPILAQTLENEGIAHLFPIQEKVVPFIINGQSKPPPFWPNDVCVSAPTGSGKTLAFVLPIVQVLMQSVGRNVRALIVLPVQELAIQVAKVFNKYCTNTGLKVALLSGAVPLQQEQAQLIKLTSTAGWQSKVDIIVCTAGRLVEHLHNTEGFSLHQLRFLVIDEADRIMDHIQNDWLYHLDRHVKQDNEIMTGKMPPLCTEGLYNQKRPMQKLLFSATLSQDPEKLEQWGLYQPKLFSSCLELRTSNNEENLDVIRKYTTPAELTEHCTICEAEQKPLVLYHLITDKKWDKVLCFTNAGQSAHRLVVMLNHLSKNQFKVAEISSALTRSSRELVLKQFHNGEINVLVSTDALARGIDVPNCNYVVSYDPPKNVKTYIHRVGRTGRAGKSGVAVTILLQNQMSIFKDLLHSTGKSSLPQIDIPQEVYENLSGKYENAIKNTKKLIYNETNKSVKKSLALKRGYKRKGFDVKSKDKESKRNQFVKKNKGKYGNEDKNKE